jgi:hypothetical protein
MNARPNTRELDRIRSAVGSALRAANEVAAPAPQSLIALLKELETRVRAAERERAFAAVELRVAELLSAVGRQPRDVRRSQGGNADETVDLCLPARLEIVARALRGRSFFQRSALSRNQLHLRGPHASRIQMAILTECR